jgi:hypothetical protein
MAGKAFEDFVDNDIGRPARDHGQGRHGLSLS